MTPLNQQLEDKKKGCGVDIGGVPCGEFIAHTEDEDGREWGKTYYCKHCHSEIAILEQAIAEIKNIQSQQTSKEIVSSSELANADISNLLQKQRQEILDKIRLEFHTFREEFIESELEIEDFDIGNLLYNIEQQLNQPKTEE